MHFTLVKSRSEGRGEVEIPGAMRRSPGRWRTFGTIVHRGWRNITLTPKRG